MNKTIGSVVAVILAATTASCSSEDDERSAVDRDQAPIEAAWTTKLDVLGQPASKDGVSLVLAHGKGKSIDAVAVDSKTGKQLWKQPWSPGAVVTGYQLIPRVFESRSGRAMAVFSVPPKNLKANSMDMWKLPITVRDLRTGEEIHRIDKTYQSTPLTACDDEVDACFDHSTKGGQRINLDQGTVGDDPNGAPGEGRSISSQGLYSSGDRPGEEIGVRRDGKTLWSTPIEDLMGKDVSTDTGWNVAHDEDADRYVAGMVAFPKETLEKAQAGKDYTYDFGWDRLVAFDGKTGKKLWQKPGAEFDCLGIKYESPEVRCVRAGTVNYTQKNDKKQSINKPAVTVEGFDPKTGETRWSMEVATKSAQSVIFGETNVVAGGDVVLIPSRQGPQVVDMESGEKAKAAAADVFTCESEPESFDYGMNFYINEKPITERRGTGLYKPCTANGKDAKTFTAPAIRDTDSDADNNFHVIATKDGLSGFKIADEDGDEEDD